MKCLHHIFKDLCSEHQKTIANTQVFLKCQEKDEMNNDFEMILSNCCFVIVQMQTKTTSAPLFNQYKHLHG